MSDDIKGLHDRFGHLEKSFVEVRAEQHEMSKSLVGVGHRIDIMEVQVQAAQARETLVVKAVNEKLDSSTAMIKKLFDKFDSHDFLEIKERKERAEKELAERDARNKKELDERDDMLAENRRQRVWLISTCVSALISIGLLWLGKVIAG